MMLQARSTAQTLSPTPIDAAGSVRAQLGSHPQALCTDMLGVAWCPILAALSCLFVRATRAADVAMLLEVYTECVSMCGNIAMATPREVTGLYKM